MARRSRGGAWRPAGVALPALLVLTSGLVTASCGGSTLPSHRTGSVWTPTTATSTPTPFQRGDWPAFDFNAARTGDNSGETAITPSSVGSLHRIWSADLPGVADSTPILLRDLALPDGTHLDTLYLTTLGGSLVALDAATGSQLWVAQTSGPNLTNSSPVADPSRAFVYSYGLDGHVHKYSATTGREATGGGWPLVITRMAQSEKESSALDSANGYLYVTTSGYLGDAPPYQGHLIAISLASGVAHVYNSLCSDRADLMARNECPDNGSGIWARAGAVVDPVTGYVFVTTGNGPYTANQGGHDWGDSVLELSGDGSRLIDSYTPTNFADLAAGDTDLGSAAPALLPAIPSSQTPYLAVQAGKDGLLRLLDRQNLSGQGGPGHVAGELQTIATPGSCAVLTQPATWTDPAGGALWLFVTDSCGTAGYQVVTARSITTLRQIWAVQQGGTSPVVAGDVLFSANSGAVFALDPHTGHRIWSSAGPGTAGTIGDVHWESPIVVGGRVYCSDQAGHVTAYGL